MKAKQKSITPISERMKQLRGLKLSQNQRLSASEFVKKKEGPQEEEEFRKWFEKCLQLDAYVTDFPKAGKRAQSHHKKTIRRIENEITPGPKAAAIANNRDLKKAVLECLAEPDAPQNITHLIIALRKKGVLKRKYGAGGSSERSDTAVRAILHDAFGITGKPGRPKRRSN